MTLAQQQKEIARLRQRARRAQTRLNKFKLKLALEGYETHGNDEYWGYARAKLFAAWELQDVLDASKYKIIKNVMVRTLRA